MGRDSETWSNSDKADLIALSARTAEDAFMTWVADRAVHWWHQYIGRFLKVCIYRRLFNLRKQKMLLTVDMCLGASRTRILGKHSLLF